MIAVLSQSHQCEPNEKWFSHTWFLCEFDDRCYICALQLQSKWNSIRLHLIIMIVEIAWLWCYIERHDGKNIKIDIERWIVSMGHSSATALQLPMHARGIHSTEMCMNMSTRMIYAKACPLCVIDQNGYIRRTPNGFWHENHDTYAYTLYLDNDHYVQLSVIIYTLFSFIRRKEKEYETIRCEFTSCIEFTFWRTHQTRMSREKRNVREYAEAKIERKLPTIFSNIAWQSSIGQ